MSRELIIRKQDDIGFHLVDNNYLFGIDGIEYRFDMVAVIGGKHKTLKEIICDYSYSGVTVVLEIITNVYPNTSDSRIADFAIFNYNGQLLTRF